MNIYRLGFRVFVLILLCLITRVGYSQSLAITLVDVNDWGSGFIARFQYVISDDDVALDQVRDWRLELNYQGSATLTNAWVEGYSGNIRVGDFAPDGGFAITTEEVGYRPELGAGHSLIFNLQGQGSGFQLSEFSPEFVNLTKLPSNEFTSSLVSVNDWFNSAWGGGFNATFRCDVLGPDVPNGPVTDLLIEFNYSGSGTPTSAWTQSHNGPIDYGFIAPDGGYAISNTAGFQPELFAGDSVTFAIQVNGAGFSPDDFDVSCKASEEGGALNSAPVSLGLSVDAIAGSAIEIELVGSDAEGDTLSFTIIDTVSSGVLSGIPPNVEYTPNPSFSGTDSFSYTVSDGELTSDPALVELNVALADAPTASASTVLLDEDTAVSFELIGNSSSSRELTYTLVDLPLNGQITGVAPNLVFNPNENFFGLDKLSFVTNDGSQDSLPAIIEFAVKSINDAPQAGEDQSI